MTCPHCGKEIRRATGNTISIKQYAESIGLSVPDAHHFRDTWIRPNAKTPVKSDPWFYMSNAGNRRYKFKATGTVFRWIHGKWEETPEHHIPAAILAFREILQINENQGVIP